MVDAAPQGQEQEQEPEFAQDDYLEMEDKRVIMVCSCTGWLGRVC